MVWHHDQLTNRSLYCGISRLRGGALTRGDIVGRTRFVVAALSAWVGTAAAQQPTPAPPTPVPPQSAADLYKQGQDMTARGDHVTAVSAFARAHELEPNNWEYKLALADAERQSNQCDKAVPRYKELLDAPTSDKARVKAGVGQCPNVVVIEPPPPQLQLPPRRRNRRSSSVTDRRAS